MNSDLSSLINKNPIQNIACKGFFSNYPVEDYYIEKDSTIIFGKSDHLWAHIVSRSKSELSSLLSNYHTKANYYFSVEEWMISLILNYGISDWIITTNRYILDANVMIDSLKTETSQIDESNSPYIYENSDYQKYTSIEYIDDRLAKDISAGIWVKKQLVAWGFTHDDGALGFLHVLNEFRKNGYGIDILNSLIKERKKTKKTIFVNIVPENIPAINLVEKIGFKFDRKVSWIKLK